MKIVKKEEAIKLLKQGKIGIFPTDTAFGIGCRIDDEKSLKRLFDIRKRPEEKAVLALVSSIQMAEEYVKPFSDSVRDLMTTHWPGGLTIVLSCNTQKVPSIARGGGATLGVRLPDHELIRSIIANVGIPVVAPSANFAGGKTPFKFADVDPELIELVDFALVGECMLGKPSTVLDCSVNPWKLVRAGAVNISI